MDGVWWMMGGGWWVVDDGLGLGWVVGGEEMWEIEMWTRAWEE